MNGTRDHTHELVSDLTKPGIHLVRLPSLRVLTLERNFGRYAGTYHTGTCTTRMRPSPS